MPPPLQRQFASEHYQNLAKLLSSTQPEKQPELGQLYRQYKAAAAAAVRGCRAARRLLRIACMGGQGWLFRAHSAAGAVAGIVLR